MRASLRDEAGVSLVELLVSLSVAMVVTTAVAGGLLNATSASVAGKNRVVAVNLASADLELARSTPSASLVPGPATSTTRTVGAVTYTVTRAVTWRSAASPVNRCSGSGTGRNALKQVATTVSWTTGGKRRSVTNETVIAPPAGENVSDAGAQRVRVYNRSFGRASGVPVTMTGPSSPAGQTTDSYGCVLFAPLANGAYTVSLNVPGHVDPQGNAVSTRAVSIAGSDTPALVEMQYDQGGTVTSTAVAPLSGGSQVYPVPTGGVGTTVFHSALSGSGTKASPVGTQDVAGLFAWPHDRYSVWAGRCADADPAFHGFARTVSAPTTPGATSSVNVPTANFRFRLKLGTGASDVSPHTDVVVVKPGTASCPSSVANPGKSGGTVGVAYTVRSGSDGMCYISLPYGTWRVEPLAGSSFVNNANSTTLRPDTAANPSTLDIRLY